MSMMGECGNVLWDKNDKEKHKENKVKPSFQRIYKSVSIVVHKCSCHLYWPEYGIGV